MWPDDKTTVNQTQSRPHKTEKRLHLVFSSGKTHEIERPLQPIEDRRIFIQPQMVCAAYDSERSTLD
jgi:hypothetical protein